MCSQSVFACSVLPMLMCGLAPPSPAGCVLLLLKENLPLLHVSLRFPEANPKREGQPLEHSHTCQELEPETLPLTQKSRHIPVRRSSTELWANWELCVVRDKEMCLLGI